MKELLFEVINEAKNGQVIIDYESWPICFNTLLKVGNTYETYTNDNQYPVLLLDNLNKFLELLKRYLDLEISLNRRHTPFIGNHLRNHQKILIAYLFVNATTDDFLNPCAMLETKIAFLQDKKLSQINHKINLEQIPNSHLKITSSLDSIQMETPYKLTLSITDGNDTYQLPSISYGISHNKCYIYSVLNPKQEINTPYQKKIKRLLYKINESVPEENLYVSPSAVLSLSIFVKLLKLNNIKNIKVIPYLPLRYLSRDLFAKDNEELVARNDFIQTNATNKFLDNFFRLQYHGLVDINSYPYELDDSLHLTINNESTINNSFLSSINTKITK